MKKKITAQPLIMPQITQIHADLSIFFLFYNKVLMLLSGVSQIYQRLVYFFK